jgi:hypothetical protein
MGPIALLAGNSRGRLAVAAAAFEGMPNSGRPPARSSGVPARPPGAPPLHLHPRGAAGASTPHAPPPRPAPRRARSPPPQQQRGPDAGAGRGAAHQPFRPYSVLPLVSSAVEAASEMASFEALAGRSAMVRPPAFENVAAGCG